MWEEHWEAVSLFITLRTQWLRSFDGPTGLNYVAIKPTIELMGLADHDPQELFRSIQIMEDEALSIIHKKT